MTVSHETRPACEVFTTIEGALVNKGRPSNIQGEYQQQLFHDCVVIMYVVGSLVPESYQIGRP